MKRTVSEAEKEGLKRWNTTHSDKFVSTEALQDLFDFMSDEVLPGIFTEEEMKMINDASSKQVQGKV